MRVTPLGRCSHTACAERGVVVVVGVGARQGVEGWEWLEPPSCLQNATSSTSKQTKATATLRAVGGGNVWEMPLSEMSLLQRWGNHAVFGSIRGNIARVCLGEGNGQHGE